MKKTRILIAAICAIGLSLTMITGCATKDAVAPQETETNVEEKKTDDKPVVKEKEPEPEPIPEPEPEPQDPPSVAFAKMLKAELAKNNIEGAIALFDNLPEGLEMDTELKLLLASLYYSDAQYQNAIDVVNEILAEEPNNLDALELLALCYHATGNGTQYKATSDRILKADPYNANANIQKAHDYARAKKYKPARESYTKVLKGDPKNLDALFGYGQMSYYLDDIKSANRTFEKILELDPNNAQALSYMGKLAADDENYLRASKYFTQAIEQDPYNYDYWLDYGTCLRNLGKYDEACNAWIKATTLDPTYFLAYAYLAGNYDERNMFDKALAMYQKVIETNPKYFYAYEETGILAYHLKNYDEAIKNFSKAYEYSNSYAYKLMISACYTLKGDKLTAKKVLQDELKVLERNSIEYDMVRFHSDVYSKNAEALLISKISKESNSTVRGKMLFYMGLYCELNNIPTMAGEYYAKVTAMQAPMFFEYRIAEWSLGL